MAYATVFHVEARNPGRGQFTASTEPTATQVIGYLGWAESMMDLVLNKAGYDVPVTGAPTTTQVLLEDVCAAGAWYRAEWAARASDRRKEAEDMWESALSMLKTAELPGVDKDAAQSLPRGSSNATPPFFTRTMLTRTAASSFLP